MRIESLAHSRPWWREPAVGLAPGLTHLPDARDYVSAVLVPDVIAPSSGPVPWGERFVLPLEPDAAGTAGEHANRDGGRETQPEPPRSAATRPDGVDDFLEPFPGVLSLRCERGLLSEPVFSHHVLEVHSEVVQVLCDALQFLGVTAYRLGLPRDCRFEVPKHLRHGRSDARRLLAIREGGGDRTDGFLVAVDVGDDAAFGLRELLSEHVLRWRAIWRRALVLALDDYVPQARDVLPQARVLGPELLELLQLLADFEQELAVVLRAPVWVAVRCLTSLELALRLVGVGPVVRHGEGPPSGWVAGGAEFPKGTGRNRRPPSPGARRPRTME